MTKLCKDCYMRVSDCNACATPKISISDRKTNGSMVEKFFGKDVYCNLIRMMYSPCCEKLKKWWNTPYKKEVKE